MAQVWSGKAHVETEMRGRRGHQWGRLVYFPENARLFLCFCYWQISPEMSEKDCRGQLRAAPHTAGVCGDRDVTRRRMNDQPGGDYETCQHPVAKSRCIVVVRHAMSWPCRGRVAAVSQACRDMSRPCRGRVASMSRRVAAVSRASRAMSRRVALCRTLCDVDG